MQALERFRKTQERQALRALGAVTISAVYGAKAASPSDEQRILELPTNTQYQLPLQDPVTGKRYYNPAIDPSTDTYHPRR